jgi:uncharacterized protein (DUF4415 family)
MTWRCAHLDIRSQMSKKNNQNTRRKQHAFDLQREAAVKKKTAVKAAAKQRALAAKPKQLKGGKKAKGIRIRKNVVVAVRRTGLAWPARCKGFAALPGWRPCHIGALSHCHEICALQGITVRDAASKRAAKEAVKERREAAGMEMDDE